MSNFICTSITVCNMINNKYGINFVQPLQGNAHNGEICSTLSVKRNLSLLQGDGH